MSKNDLSHHQLSVLVRMLLVFLVFPCITDAPSMGPDERQVATGGSNIGNDDQRAASRWSDMI